MIPLKNGTLNMTGAISGSSSLLAVVFSGDEKPCLGCKWLSQEPKHLSKLKARCKHPKSVALPGGPKPTLIVRSFYHLCGQDRKWFEAAEMAKEG